MPRVPLSDDRDRESNARLFMALFMGSWSIGFLALFAAQLYLRLDAVTWPPAGSPPPPLLVTGISCLFVMASSGLYQFGLSRIERGKPGLQLGLIGATALAFLFLMLQLAAGAQAQARGLDWSESAYAAVFWITGGFHFLHVVVGVAAGVWLSVQAPTFSPDRHLPVRLWGYYWHSVGLIWLLIYLFIFVL